VEEETRTGGEPRLSEAEAETDCGRGGRRPGVEASRATVASREHQGGG